jgi:hypothetical protein
MTATDLTNIINESGLTRKQWYSQVYLRSHHWKTLRRGKLDKVGRKCEKCGTTRRLEVHHLEYRNIYDVKFADLQVLCAYHHGEAHGRIKAQDHPTKARREPKVKKPRKPRKAKRVHYRANLSPEKEMQNRMKSLVGTLHYLEGLLEKAKAKGTKGKILHQRSKAVANVSQLLDDHLAKMRVNGAAAVP